MNSDLVDRIRASWQSPFFQDLEDRVFTYGDLWCTAEAIQQGWQNRGLKSGDIIAFKLPNSFALPCLYMACAIGGHIACPVVPSLRQETIEENLEDLRPALLIEDTNWFEPVISGEAPEVLSQIGRDIPFLIMFSSGSTGKNKAICHNLAAVTGSAAAFAELSGFSDDTRLYHVLPMTYMAGFLNAMLAVIMAGGKVVEGPQFSMESVADFWQRPLSTDANTLSVIPPLAAAVCRLTRDSKKIEQVTQQFTQVQCTSQAIPADLRSRFLEKFSLALQDCYGMTELGGPLSLQTHADALAKNDQSTPIAGIEVSIQDDGALWIASSYRMMGYLKSGKLVSPFDEKGFLDTGDLATMNGPCIEITGRVKDLIIRGGINTSPARIESVMSECEAIEEVAVLGMPHSFWGEEIVAVVVGANFDEGVIMAFCRRRLDTHEVPDRVIQMQELPRSFIGKVLKKNLAEQLKR